MSVYALRDPRIGVIRYAGRTSKRPSPVVVDLIMERAVRMFDNIGAV